MKKLIFVIAPALLLMASCSQLPNLTTDCQPGDYRLVVISGETGKSITLCTKDTSKVEKLVRRIERMQQ